MEFGWRACSSDDFIIFPRGGQAAKPLCPPTTRNAKCPEAGGLNTYESFFCCGNPHGDLRNIRFSRKKEIYMTEIARQKTRASRSSAGVRFVAVTGILSAAAFVLQLLEIPLPFMPFFIKFDFSDLPALLGSFALGPVCGVVIELIKNLLHALYSSSFGVGEISNFVLGAVFVAVAGAVYGHKKTKKSAIIASVVGAVAMALISLPSNLFVVYPVYYQFMPEKTILAAYQAIIPSMKSVAQSLVVFNMPFTFVKGMIDVVISFLIYTPPSPILKRSRR